MIEKISDLIVIKNQQFLAFNKPSGLAVQADKTGDKSLKDLAEIYCKHKLFICNRIDRPASGLIIFACNKKSAAHINEQFRNAEIAKTYLALVKSPVKVPKQELTHELSKDSKTNKSYIGPSKSLVTKMAKLTYELMKSSDNYSLLKINLITGRHHQIRAQLAHVGMPVKGDVKYGFRRSNKDRSIHLHSWKASLTHPTSKERINLIAEPPKEVLWDFFKPALGE